MAMLQGNILNDLKRERLVREGHFTFSSGCHSAALLDLDHLTTDPVALGHMAYATAKAFFTNRVHTVASPSIQGAGLALWVAHYLDPKARVVGAESGPDGRPPRPRRRSTGRRCRSPRRRRPRCSRTGWPRDRR